MIVMTRKGSEIVEVVDPLTYVAPISAVLYFFFYVSLILILVRQLFSILPITSSNSRRCDIFRTHETYLGAGH